MESSSRKYRRAYRKISFLVIPLLGMFSTTPIFLVTGNDLILLPLIWIMICLPLTLAWIVNIRLYERFFERPLVLYSLSFSIIIIVTSGFRFIVLQSVGEPFNLYVGTIKNAPPIASTAFLGVLDNAMILIVQSLVRIRADQQETNAELFKIRIQRTQDRYDSLRNHIHPHFLFNALNTLKVLIRRDSGEAETYLLKLSSFLRHSIESADHETFTVKEDLEIGVNYLEIQRVRFRESIQWKIDPSISELHLRKVPILTFQTLFENALKHNRISEENPLVIWITSKGNDIIVSNEHLPMLGERDSGTKKGLYNLSERFKLLHHSTIAIDDDNNHFSVTVPTLPG